MSRLFADQWAKGVGPEGVTEVAVAAESEGFDALWVTESNNDVLHGSLSGLQATSRLTVATGIAVAFARPPEVLARAAWELAGASSGRFILGLGSSTRTAIEDRFAMPWTRPVERMRDYLTDLRAMWESWRDEDRQPRDPLGTNPAVHDHAIPIYLGAVGSAMTELCGQEADGLLLHPMASVRAVTDVALPALDRGLARDHRPLAAVQVHHPLFVVTGSGTQRDRVRAMVLDQMAWYGARPPYRPLLQAIGQGDLTDRLATLRGREQRAARRELVVATIYDELAIDASPEVLAAELAGRVHPRVARVSSYFGWQGVDAATRREILAGAGSCRGDQPAAAEPDAGLDERPDDRDPPLRS